jgi:glycosyltransferase involved in cell wall biosynthesis
MSAVARHLRSLLGRERAIARSPAVSPALAELARHGPAPLTTSRPAEEAPLRIATIVPSFRRGSGGHATIVNLLHELRALGHDVSLWLEDCEGRHAREPAEVTQRSFAEFFRADGLPLHTDFGAWNGADVALATGWQTVARALLLEGVGARAYLVQDHEPDFYGASAERLFAEETYRQGLHCIAASAWLAGLLRERYGASASHFDLAVDHSIYHSGEVGRCEPGNATEHRLEDLVVFYARAVTPRRAVPLGLLALAELARRRPNVEIALFGEDRPLEVPFPHTNLGVLPARELAALYRRATVGMVFSLTNPSLIGLEMMACGLPCVEMASEAMVASFEPEGPLALAEPRVDSICANLRYLLDDKQVRTVAGRAGVELMANRNWRTSAIDIAWSLQAAMGAPD